MSIIAGAVILWGGYAFGRYGLVVVNELFGFRNFVDEFYSNASTELFSIGVTVLIIDDINRLRAREVEKGRLILQMGSDDNILAKEAVRIMRLEGWLTTSTLKHAPLVS